MNKIYIAIGIYKGVPVYHIYVQLDQIVLCVRMQFPKFIEQIQFFFIVIDSQL